MNGKISRKVIINLGLILFVITILSSCKQSAQPVQETSMVETNIATNISEKKHIDDYDHSKWIEITEAKGVQLDIRYASTNNFTGKLIYDCPRCFLRPEAAMAINRIHYDLKEKYGYGLKLFDCYRPRPAQQKLWDIKPDANYVTPPKRGSMHNRGQAIDLTIIDENGVELNMGTAYDYFGEEAHRTYYHPDTIVRRNRALLREIMEFHQFTGIRTEWWHYSLKIVYYPLSNWEWSCEE